MQYHRTVTDILELLSKNGCWFETFEHEPVVTSEEAAKLRHGYSISQGAKAIIVKIKGLDRHAPVSSGLAMTPKPEFVMLVLPGDKKFSGSKVKKLLDTKDLRFASEEEISKQTGGIKIGGIPPFGNLFGIRVFVEKTLLDNEKIIFNAGDRSFSVAVKKEDYLNIVRPEIEEIIGN
jgi:prolyl-tRNA editing enzyme YbaK/EbsC (Cys-tRNA(Pro) deacylase)